MAIFSINDLIFDDVRFLFDDLGNQDSSRQVSASQTLASSSRFTQKPRKYVASE